MIDLKNKMIFKKSFEDLGLLKALMGVLRDLESEELSSRRLWGGSCWGAVVKLKAPSVESDLEMCVLHVEVLYLKQPTCSQAMSSDRFAQARPSLAWFSRVQLRAQVKTISYKKQENHIFEIQSHGALPPRQMFALLPPIRK